MSRILIDMSPVMYSSFISANSEAVRNGLKPDKDTNKNPFIYKTEVIFKILEEILLFKMKFQASEVILSFDNSANGGYWRKKEYARLKYGRGKVRKESDLDWGEAFKCFTEVKQILKDFSSMKVVDVPHAEADDHAFVLSEYFQDKGGVTLISLDGDWEHALNYDNVKLFKTRKTQKLNGIFIELTESELNEKTQKTLLCGDPKDGILHITSWTQFSPEFLEEHPKFKGKEQALYHNHHEIERMYDSKYDFKKKAYKHPRMGWKSFKKGKKSLDDILAENPIHLENYNRNKLLCLPSGVPDNLKSQIIEEYLSSESKKNSKELQRYFKENRMFELIGHLINF